MIFVILKKTKKMIVKVKKLVEEEMEISFPFFTKEFGSVSKWFDESTRIVVKENSIEIVTYSLFSPDNEITEQEFKAEFDNFLKKLDL